MGPRLLLDAGRIKATGNFHRSDGISACDFMRTYARLQQGEHTPLLVLVGQHPIEQS